MQEDQWENIKNEALFPDWFSSTAHGNQLDGQTKDHCKYVDKKSNSIFLYRYRKIGKDEKVSDVLDEVVNDICHIFETYGQH